MRVTARVKISVDLDFEVDEELWNEADEESRRLKIKTEIEDELGTSLYNDDLEIEQIVTYE